MDDDPSLRRLLAVLLAHAGYFVDTAPDGEQGWVALNLRQYDLLLTDNDMPHLDGLGLIRRLRAAGMTLPVIVVSGSERVHRLAERDSLDLSALLPKPFQPGDLMASVARAAPIPPDSPPGLVQAAPKLTNRTQS